MRPRGLFETDASYYFGTSTYFTLESVWEEESYYNGWHRDAFKRWAQRENRKLAEEKNRLRASA